MTVQLLTNIVIGLVVVGFVVSRQLRWRRIDRAGVWKTPAILAIIGLFSLSQTAAKTPGHPVDVLLIGVELAISIVVGLIMGRMTTFRVAGTPDDKGRLIEARTSAQGVALWVLVIVVRIGLDVVGGFLGAHLLTATGVILLTLAANRGAQALMMDGRLPQVARVRA